MQDIANDGPLTILVLRLFNARHRMRDGEPGQRSRFFALLTAIGVRRRQLTA